MLEEAIELMRMLWTGDLTTEWTAHYVVDRAAVRRAGDGAAGRGGGGDAGHGPLRGPGRRPPIATAPDLSSWERSARRGAKGNPCTASSPLCWGPELEKAKDEALEWWPNTSVPGIGVELAEPEHFESVAQPITADQVAEKVVCGPDAGAIASKVRGLRRRGLRPRVPHQVGPRQEEFLSSRRTSSWTRCANEPPERRKPLPDVCRSRELASEATGR